MTLKYGCKSYRKALNKLGLTVYKRYDPASAKVGGWAEYLVAPVIENDKKIEWQIYHNNPAFRDDANNGVKPTMESFKTKKEAVKYLRDEIKSMAFLELDNYSQHEFR